jgi:hypothetical protein
VVRRQAPTPVPVAPVDDPDPEPDDSDVDEAVPAPRPVPPRVIRPAVPQGAEREPVIVDKDDEPADDMPAVAPTPGNPFGVPIGSGRPGVIAPTPQQPQQPQR